MFVDPAVQLGKVDVYLFFPGIYDNTNGMRVDVTAPFF